jgi:hypothetical protein
MHGLFAVVEQRGPEDRHLGQAAVLGQHDAAAPQREHAHLRFAHVRQVG